jgi:hypothetical protein
MVAASRRLVTLLRVIVVLLSVQFVLGIWVNLFGSFPSTSNVEVAAVYSDDAVLTGHYVLAIVLVIVALVLVFVSFGKEERKGLRWLALGGLLSILWASASGVQFILSGFSNNVDSFSMALAFIAATSFYGVAQALVLPAAPSSTPQKGDEKRTAASK